VYPVADGSISGEGKAFSFHLLCIGIGNTTGEAVEVD
jgi:hypothetical protein